MTAKRTYVSVVRFILAFTTVLLVPASCQTAPLQNRWLTVAVRPQDGSFELRAEALRDPVLAARVGAEVNHQWLWSTDYPNHQVAASTFQSPLGPGHQVEILFSGLTNKPNLRCILQLFDERPFGNVRVTIENTGQEPLSVQNIRMLDMIGTPLVNLGAPEETDRVLSDSYSEDRPPLHIVDLGKAHTYLGEDEFSEDFGNLHLAVGSQLIYNRQSGFSLLLAALTSDRWLTILHLNTAHPTGGDVQISSYTVDSTGTTEIMKKESIRENPSSDQIELSLPLAPGGQISSEQLAFSVGKDYHAQLESYGEIIRLLHNARIPDAAPWGWWSWTAYYFGLSEGTALSNAQFLSQHLKSLGYDFFHIDEGYAYDDGEYMTPNATLFPDGIRQFSYRLSQLGLRFAMWAAPFRVAQRAWVYENHPEWLVHDAQGKPIQIGFIESSHDPLYVLDATHPGAQDYLRKTFQTLSRDWGARYFKLDFMDDTAIEGYRYRPDVTALEAERIGLKIIRDAVGDAVLLDKDGSPMLNTVGLTDLGRTSTDTGHSFLGEKEDATGIAARYYMNGNFYVADPDAFSVSEQLITDQTWHQSKAPLTLDEAELSIALAAVAGGMFEIGDDLPTLGSEPDRLTLLQNRDLLNMVRLKCAAKPLDLMTYAEADEQPSIFLLREDKRQSMLAIFNWTDSVRSHDFQLTDLGLSSAAAHASDVFRKERAVTIAHGVLRIENQAAHSVRLIKIVDNSTPASPPLVVLQAPSQAQLGKVVHLSAALEPESVPALAYHWDFGDGISAQVPSADHAYTRNGTYKIVLQVEGVDGIMAVKTAAITVQGTLKTTYDVENSRRFQEH
ncbi:MAG: PKD domain-containing protein [Terriglobales bacterium]